MVSAGNKKCKTAGKLRHLYSRRIWVEDSTQNADRLEKLEQTNLFISTKGTGRGSKTYKMSHQNMWARYGE